MSINPDFLTIAHRLLRETVQQEDIPTVGRGRDGQVFLGEGVEEGDVVRVQCDEQGRENDYCEEDTFAVATRGFLGGLTASNLSIGDNFLDRGEVKVIEKYIQDKYGVEDLADLSMDKLTPDEQVFVETALATVDGEMAGELLGSGLQFNDSVKEDLQAVAAAEANKDESTLPVSLLEVAAGIEGEPDEADKDWSSRLSESDIVAFNGAIA